MPIRRTPIRSSSNPADGFPWAVIAPDGPTLDIDVLDFKGLKDPAKHDKCKGKKKLKLKVGKETERHALLVTFDGDLLFLPFSELPPVCYAHLGFYDPATDDFELLEFVE